MPIPVLPIQQMDLRHPGLTKHLAGSYLEAASVALSNNHTPPQPFEITHSNSSKAEQKTLVEWAPPDTRCLRAYNNKDDATRDGAYACAIAAVELVAGLRAVGRAETLTGADFYVAESAEDPEDFEDCIRLEISGTQKDINEVRRRLNKKVQQAKDGKSSLPALAAVVGFEARCIQIQAVNL